MYDARTWLYVVVCMPARILHKHTLLTTILTMNSNINNNDNNCNINDDDTTTTNNNNNTTNNKQSPDYAARLSDVPRARGARGPAQGARGPRYNRI